MYPGESRRTPSALAGATTSLPDGGQSLEGLAGGSAVFAAISLDGHIASASWWGVLLIFVVFLPALLVRLVQNGRVPAQPMH